MEAEVIDLVKVLQERRRGQRASRAGKRRHATKRPASALEALTRRELYERARARGIPGRSRMTKDELINALTGRY